MMMIPLETEGHEHDALILILSKNNVERLRQADPVEVNLSETGYRLVNPTIMVCYEEDEPALTRLLHAGDLKAIIKHLQRGWKFRLEEGDHDRGPERLNESN